MLTTHTLPKKKVFDLTKETRKEILQAVMESKTQTIH